VRKKKFDISSLSKHLFWDVDVQKINLEKNKNFIIQRVLQYGLLTDWIYIYKYYGWEVIVDVTKKLRDIDDKTIYFIAALSNTPLDDFLCYTTKQSIPRHWNF